MVERMPAVICDVKRISTGRYVEMPGWEPNFVVMDDRLKVSRVNVIGTITQAEQDGTIVRYALADASGMISLRSYETNELEASPGDLVIVIGRPRAYQDEIYLVPEIIRKVEPAWAAYRKRQLELLETERSALEPIEITEPEAPSEPRAESPRTETRAPEPVGDATDTERIYALIERIDSGDGADMSDVLSQAEKDGIAEAEKAIHHMLEMGDIFEIRAGKLKVL